MEPLVLSLRARKTLAFLGVTTKDELNMRSDSDLLKFRGCGRKTFRELREWSGWREYQGRMKTLKTTAWGVIHKDGSLCVALIRRTRKEAMQAQCDMFPHMTRDMFKLLGFRLRKVDIVYRSNESLTVSPDAKREANTSGGIGVP